MTESINYSDAELWQCYLAKDFDKLSVEQLVKIKKMKAINDVTGTDFEPIEKIPPVSMESAPGNRNDVAGYYNAFMNRHQKGFKSKSGYTQKIEDATQDLVFQYREAGTYKECGMQGMWGNTDSDTGCEDVVSDWSPADTYAKTIWSTAICKADLFKIAVKGIEINPGDGLSVQIRAFGAFGDPSSLGACECASCASITFTTYTLTLAQYNLEAVVCNLDAFDVGGVLMDAYITSMSDSWARWFDAQIYAQLETASPGTSTQLPADLNCTPAISGSCCSDASLVNLYNAFNETIASMREGTGLTAGAVNPDYIIISPSVAAVFKRMQSPTPMPWFSDIKFDDNGRLSKIAGLKVIEYCGANSCTDLADEVVAIVIDSRQAVGAVFGQRPKTYKFLQTNCNSVRIDMWSYFGTAELNTDCIAHIINAS